MTGPKKMQASVGLLMLTALGLMLYILFFPLQAMENIRNSLRIFAFSVLPSLAVFSVCTKILIKTGLIRTLSSSPLMAFTQRLRISPSGFAAFIFGTVAGFPMGASILAELCENGEITSEEASSLLPFCNQAGASFVVGTMGTMLFGDVRYGWILFFAQIAAALTALSLTTFTRKPSALSVISPCQRVSPFSVLTASVSESAGAMLCVCGFIVFFSLCGDAAFRLCSVLPLARAQGLSPVFSGLLEISSGVTLLAHAPFSTLTRLILSSTLLGFGGFCVFLQAIDRTQACFYAPQKYLFGKLLEAILCPFFAFLLFEMMKMTLLP